MVLLVKQWTIRKFRDVLQLREFGREFLLGDDQEWRSCQFNESKPLSARTWAAAVTVESDVDIRLMHDKVCGVVGGQHIYCKFRPLQSAERRVGTASYS